MRPLVAKQIAMIRSDGRSAEVRHRSAVVGVYARVSSNCDFLCEKCGDQDFQFIRHMSRAGMDGKSIPAGGPYYEHIMEVRTG